jgi:hypothetical protein
VATRMNPFAVAVQPPACAVRLRGDVEPGQARDCGALFAGLLGLGAAQLAQLG